MKSSFSAAGLCPTIYILTVKFGPFEFIVASNSTVACFWDLFGEISSRLLHLAIAKRPYKALKYILSIASSF